MSSASLAFASKKKLSRREQFLNEMDRVVPRARLCALVAPHYPKGERGRPVRPLERMPPIYFMQQWFNLSDPAMEEALYDSASMRSFAGLDLADDGAPDETTILNFRHLLAQHRLTEAMFAEVGALRAERGLMRRRGTIVDATIIEAPSATKNAKQTRDPEMSQTKKRNSWHFGMKVHVGAQAHGLPLVHSVAVGTAAENDLRRLGELVHRQERELFGDRGYWSREDRSLCQEAGIADRVQHRSRARVEHPFLVIERLWGFAKVRYRGLYKNALGSRLPGQTGHLEASSNPFRPRCARQPFNAAELERHAFGPESFHVEMQIGDSVVVIEAGDLPPEVSPWKGAIYVYVEDVDAVYSRALNLGAKPLALLEDKPYQERRGTRSCCPTISCTGPVQASLRAARAGR